jgi:hypothetical protein
MRRGGHRLTSGLSGPPALAEFHLCANVQVCASLTDVR